jgi:hypothetical protein
MPKRILIILLKLAGITAIFIAQICVANLLSPPWNRLNIIFISALWLLVMSPKRNFIWYIFFLSLVIDLFHSSPFGVNTAALLISLYCMDWLLTNILTNRFFVIIFLAGLTGIALYKLAYLVLMSACHFIFSTSFLVNSSFILDIVYEMLINSAALTLAYLVPSLLFKRLNPKYLSDR